MRIPWEAEIRTYIGPLELSRHQVDLGCIIEEWLSAYHEIATRFSRHRFMPGANLFKDGDVSMREFKALAKDYAVLLGQFDLADRATSGRE